MDRDDLRLSRIETLWSVVRQAHGGTADQVQSAQQALLDRYGGAVRRYLLGALRDEDAADEVFQEFSLNFVRGAFRNASPDRGRFRSFVKTSLFHLIVDHQRRQRRGAVETPLLVDTADFSDSDTGLAQQEEAFRKSWREELLSRCWKRLSQMEQTTGKLYYSVLRFRVDHPKLRSGDIAQQLGAQLNKPLTAGGVRVLIHRAREMFSDILLEEIQNSLEDASLAAVEEELIELDLLAYCRAALERRGHGSASE